MTLNDIKNEVASLLFQSDVPLDNTLIHSVSRAIRSIYSERGVVDTLSIYQSTPIAYTSVENTRVSSGKAEYPLPRGTFSIYISGEGMVRLINKNEVREYPFSRDNAHIFGYSDEDFTLSFSSATPFTINSLFYTEEAIRECDAPNGDGYYEYRLKDIKENFGSATGCARDEYDRWIKGSKIVGGTLYIPYSFSGRIFLDYKLSPPRLDIDRADEELPIPDELLHLIPLLTASYMSLDDDENRANQYYSLYRNGIVALMSGGRENTGCGYTDRLGWC